MKTKVFYLATKVTVAVILVAILVIEAAASGTPKIKVVPYAPERALIALENENEVISDLSIEDAAGNVVYYREGKISDAFYSKKFDFANLSNGEYKVTVTNNNGKNEVYFNVKGNKITVNPSSKTTAPFVDIKGDVLKLSLLNSSLNDVNLVVSNENGIVYKKSLGNDFSINAGFNLANLENGTYAIDINDGVKNYSYNFKK
jgi:hypothetical protein